MVVSQMASIAALAALASFLVCMLIVYSQHWHGAHSLDHDLDGIQKYHAKPVPRVGGIAVLGGIVLTVCALLYANPGYIGGDHIDNVIKLLLASLPAFVAGIAEDMTKRVSVKTRLSATVFSALIASALLGATIDQIDIWGVDSILVFLPVGLVVTSVVVAGGANAINIIDGFNGLSGSVIAIMSAALGALAWQAGDTLVIILSILSFGAAIGFLLLNYPTGKLFLGDGGAYFLGFWVSEIAVLLLVRNASINAWQVLSICAYPVIEVLYSIYRRKFIQKASPGAPDDLHLHTLVYRRIATRLIAASSAHYWMRNASVACIIVPWIGLMAIVSVNTGGTIIRGVAVVSAQVILYILFYNLLARPYRDLAQVVTGTPDADKTTGTS